MNKSETAKLLSLVSAFDRRTIGEADVEAWHSILADIPYEDAATAVKGHFRASDKYLMPVNVTQGVAALRQWRLKTIPMPPAPRELVDEHGYRIWNNAEKRAAFDDWYRETREAIASGKYSSPDESQSIAAIAAASAKDEANSASNTTGNFWEDLGRSPIAPRPGAEPVAELEDGRSQRDMGFVDEIADAKAVS